MEIAFELNSLVSSELNLQALGPDAQRERELEAIRNDPKIRKFLEETGQSIREITGSWGKWRVHTEDYAIDVDVEYYVDPKAPIGPGLIELVVRDPVKVS